MSHDFEPTDAEKEMMTLVQSSPAPHTNYERVTANKDDLQVIVELLADVEHERWASWQSYLHSKLYEIDDNRVSLNHHLKILPTELYARWERQIATPYSQLSESEKQSDREEVKKTLRALVQMGYRISKSDHQELQKARQTWLREEIVKLEGMKQKGLEQVEHDYITCYECGGYDECDCEGFNEALQTIIDRYQAELDQLNPII